VGLRIGRSEIGLAFLEMFNLARRVLCAHEAAVQAPHLVAFRGRVLVLEFGLNNVGSSQQVPCMRSRRARTYKSPPYVWIGMPAHGDGGPLLLVLLGLAWRQRMEACDMSSSLWLRVAV
jgi:hypothetical protein